MRIIPISESECKELLKRVSVGWMASSLNNQPYLVFVGFTFVSENNCLYLFSPVGQQIKWMRKDPKVCLQADEIGSHANWISVAVNGKYLELRQPKFTAERQRASQLLAKYSNSLSTPLTERHEVTDKEIEPVFSRINISSISGLRAM